MATNINLREERRKRIVERGSDRMALITGRLQSLPPSPRFPSSPSSSASSRSTSSSSPYHQSLLSHSTPNHISAAVEKINENNDHAYTTLADHKTTTEENTIEDHHSHIGNVSHKKPQLRKLNNISSTTNEVKQLLPQQPPSIVQKADTHKEPVRLQSSKKRLNNLFTSKELNSCIIASGDIRIFCAFVIAILVVISYVDYPLFGINLVRSRSVLASRPLYLLLLTDVTIVLAQLLYLKKQSRFEQAEEEKEVPQAEEEADNWEEAIKVLERGLVVYQAIRGIFMDCSVYTVVVVCGLSLV